MKEELKDKGLRKATRQQATFRLPSNFVYRTMQKVDEAVLLREKRTERRMLWSTIAASLFLMVTSLACLFIFFGDTIRELAESVTVQIEHAAFLLPIPCLLFTGLVLILLYFDKWMRRMYDKHHTPSS